MYQHGGKKYPTLHDMVDVMRKKFGRPTTMLERVAQGAAIEAAIEAKEQDEPSADYPLGGLVEPYDIEREKELTQ